MKASNIIIFLIVILVIAGIFGFAIWDSRTNNNVVDNNSSNTVLDNNSNSIQEQNTITENTVDQNNLVQNARAYEGEWYISQESYINSERIDDLMDRRDDRLITDEEFESLLQAEQNDEVAELDIDEFNGNTIKFDFELVGPAPTQRVARIEDITVDINNNTGTFTYTDNWGTSGNGTITIGDNQIELKLETTRVNQGTLWGVEGMYTFSYKLAD